MKIAYLTSGPRGAGKTTYVDAIKEIVPSIPVICNDRLWMEIYGTTLHDPYSCNHRVVSSQLFRLLKQYLSSEEKSNVVLVDSWNGFSRDRRDFIWRARELGADKVYCLQFFLPIDVNVDWFMKKTDKGSLTEADVRWNYDLYYEEARGIESDGFDLIIPVYPCQGSFKNI